MQMLLQLKDQAEIVIVINADDIEKNKVRGDLGITYDVDVLRLIDAFRGIGLYVGSVVHRPSTAASRLPMRSKASWKLWASGYTATIPLTAIPPTLRMIVSDEGYGKNEYIETTRPLVVVTAPGPGSGKMATCLSQLYHEHKRGVKAGYAKFETFPIWNLPLKHPVNLAYEAATADLQRCQHDRSLPSGSLWRNHRQLQPGCGNFPGAQRHFRARFTAAAPTSPPRTWASTWRATASLTMKSAARPPGRRSSAATMQAAV